MLTLHFNLNFDLLTIFAKSLNNFDILSSVSICILDYRVDGTLEQCPKRQ